MVRSAAGDGERIGSKLGGHRESTPHSSRLVAAAALAAVVGAGCIKDLGTPPGFVETLAADVTADGTVVGTGTASDNHHEAFLLSPDGDWTLIGAEAPGPPDTWSDAAAVNAAGTVVGTTSDMGSFLGRRVFTWDEGSGFHSVPVSVPGYDSAEAADINAGGQVVGSVWAGEGVRGPGFLYTPGTGTTALAPPEGHPFASATAINDAGTVVGIAGSYRAAPAAVVWAPPAYQPVTLPMPAPPSPAATSFGTSIDEDGTIGGYFNGVLPGQNDSTIIGLLWAPSPGHPYTQRPGLAIQDIEDGTAVGTVTGDDFSVKAAVWHPGDTAPVLLGSLGGYSWARAITGDHIVGYAATKGTFHAASYS